MDDNYIVRTMELIKDKYAVDEFIASKYAKMAVDALESHGGSKTDFSSVIKVVKVVVKSWLKHDGYI